MSNLFIGVLFCSGEGCLGRYNFKELIEAILFINAFTVVCLLLVWATSAIQSKLSNKYFSLAQNRLLSCNRPQWNCLWSW